MIKKITIQGFKSIRSQTVELDPVTVFVGRSGTGKSNFVQAIRFLRNYILVGEAAAEVEGGWSRLVPAGVDHPSVVIQLEFQIHGQSDLYVYRLTFGLPQQHTLSQYGRLFLQEEHLSYGDKVLFHQAGERANRWRWVSPPATVEALEPSAKLAIGRLPALQDVVYAYTALSSGIGYYNLPTSVLGIFGTQPDPHDQNVGQRLTGLRDDATNYLDVMRNIVQDLHKPQIRKSLFSLLRQLNPTVSSVELNSIPNPTYAVVGHTAKDKVLELRLDQESDGFRRFYAHLLALYQLPSKLINVFEEPENGIYPGALAILADEFKAAYDSGRGQAILTTHSPGLLDYFDVDHLRVVELRNNDTIIGRVAPEQREAVKENLLTTGELLTVDRARLDEAQSNTEAAEA